MTAPLPKRATCLLAWGLIGLATSPAFAQTWRLKVEGQGAELKATPVVVAAPASIPVGDYTLRTASGELAGPAQVFEDNQGLRLALVFDHIPAQASEIFTLYPAPKKAVGPEGFGLRREGTNVSFDFKGKPFTTYRNDEGAKPFLFPILGPNGSEYTRSYPMRMIDGEDKDHPHQRSFWFTHGKVNGVDFWSENKGHGTIKETSRKPEVAGAAVALIRTTDDWLGPDGKKVCDDERVISFFDTGANRIIDFAITIHASQGDVTFGDTKEGMFGVRVASSMDVTRKKGGKITNAEGLVDDKAWGKPSPWVDYVGPVEGKTVGIAILNHPSSFRYPTTWHVRTYGLFAANPFGWHDFGKEQTGEYVLPRGQSVTFRYRVILHEGETASAHLAEAFEGFAHPPKVTLESK
ncbi:PmoA family protein [Singulisphaera sp. PoT]|uniref:DUF6807 domain-containing protein n=1 Tax=Singulisphaera sp. PoT TaxID=3411797 RepID=UPI003BF56B11